MRDDVSVLVRIRSMTVASLTKGRLQVRSLFEARARFL